MRYTSRFIALCTAFSLLGLLIALPAVGPSRVHAAVQQFTPFQIEEVFAVTTDNTLVTFTSANPAVLNRSVAVSGLAQGENLVGITFRPATGQLYGVGSTSRVYTINPQTGAARQVGGAAFTPALSGTAFGVRFNPVPDRIRLFSNTGQNLRLNPDTGGVAGTDTALAYATGDVNAGRTPNCVAAAYTNPFSGTPSTTLFNIDSGTDALVRQGSPDGAPVSPNGGQLFTIGALGVNTTDLAGLDATLDGRLFASLTTANAQFSGFYQIDTGSGAARFLGSIPTATPVRAIAIGQTANIFAVTDRNRLVSFRSNVPGVINTSVGITGLQAGETILGIDFRPATGDLFAVGSTSRVYRINRRTGAATQIGTGAFTPAVAGAAFGVDFNPVPDRIRFFSNTGQNLRLNPDTGGVAGTDTALAYATGDRNEGATPNCVAAAYTNSFNNVTTTTIFNIDSRLGALVRMGSEGGTPISPNSGQLFTIGSLRLPPISDQVGLDISARNGIAYASVNVLGESFTRLAIINLETGEARTIGAIGTDERVVDISVENSVAALAVNVSDMPDTIAPGANLTYTVTVSNFSADPAFDVVVRNPIPANTRFVSTTASQGASAQMMVMNVPTVVANLGPIPPRGSATVTIVVTVNADASSFVSNTATATTGSADANLGAFSSATTFTGITPR